MIFEGTGIPFRAQEEILPEPAEGEVLVEIVYSTICRSDIHTYAGKRTEPTPLVLGHECIGRVCRLGNEDMKDARDEQLQVGHLITWSVFAAAEDAWTAKGLPQKSPTKKKYGHLRATEHDLFSGGFATHVLLLAGTVIVRIPKEADVRAWAPINCSLATVVGAFRIGGSPSGLRLAIYGAGMLGIQALAYARMQGAAEIVMIDPNLKRLARATTFGATETWQVGEPIANGEKFDFILETSGTLTAMAASIDQLQIGGTAVWVGAVFPQQALPIDTEKIVRNILTLKGLHNYNGDDLVASVEHMTQFGHLFPFADLVEKEFSLDQLTQAFTYALSANPYRVGIRPINNPTTKAKEHESNDDEK